MKTFKDNAGRVWTVAVNVSSIKRVRDLAGVDLLTIVDGSLIQKLYQDPVVLCDALFALCKPEADKLNITDEMFGEAMAGDPIDHATTAMLEELVSFSPSPRDRAILGQVLEKTKALMDRARDMVETKLGSGDLERALEQVLTNASSLSTSAQESAESMPDR